MILDRMVFVSRKSQAPELPKKGVHGTIRRPIIRKCNGRSANGPSTNPLDFTSTRASWVPRLRGPGRWPARTPRSREPPPRSKSHIDRVEGPRSQAANRRRLCHAPARRQCAFRKPCRPSRIPDTPKNRRTSRMSRRDQHTRRDHERRPRRRYRLGRSERRDAHQPVDAGAHGCARRCEHELRFPPAGLGAHAFGRCNDPSSLGIGVVVALCAVFGVVLNSLPFGP